MSYVPAGKPVNHWQSEAGKAGPVRPNNTPTVRSGSNRSYAPTRTGQVFSGATANTLQNSVGQYGNYLLYRDQVRFQNAHLEAQDAKAKEEQVQSAAGQAIGSMLGAPPTPGSPGDLDLRIKAAAAKAKLGSKAKVGNGGPPPLSSPHPSPVGGVGPNPIGQAQARWEQERTSGPQPVNPMAQAARVWNQQYGRTGFQPSAPQGNTATPSGPQANDPMIQRRLDAQKARDRGAGGNLSNIDWGPQT